MKICATLLLLPFVSAFQASSGRHGIRQSHPLMAHGDGQSDGRRVFLSSAGIAFLSTIAPAVANAGIDQTQQGLTEIVLDGSLSNDPENDDLTYAWSQISGTTVKLTNDQTVNPSFITPNVDDILIFSLIVNDGELDSAIDTVLITAEKINTIKSQVVEMCKRFPVYK